MFNKEWEAHYEGNQIVVENWWSFSGRSEAKLFLNGEFADASTKIFAKEKAPILRGTLKNLDGSHHIVEVFMKSGMMSLKTKICVDGVQIDGDDF